MANNINWGKIYESTAWGSGVSDNSISWGKSYADLAGGGLDADYQAVLDRSTALGYTAPSAAQQTLQNTLVTDLKTAGVWDKLDVFYVFATDGDSDYATLNWKAPSNHQATKVNSPTFTANEGFTGDGASSQINSNLNLLTDTSNYTQNSASFGGYYLSIGGSGDALAGTNSAVNTISRFTSSFRYKINGANTSTASLFSIGMLHANRNGVSSTQFYNNGVNVNDDTDTSSAIISQTLRFLSDTSAYTNSQISVGFAGADLSAEASDFNNAIENYISTI